jgi:hypothetical protein
VVGWLLAAGGASLAVIALFAVTMYVSADARRVNVTESTRSSLAYNLNRARPATVWAEWTVTRANSAHHALIVEIEARRVERARQIAEQIVNPVRSRGYQEILIYIYPVGNRDGAMRRVQWTPRGGYVESAYGAVRP